MVDLADLAKQLGNVAGNTFNRNTVNRGTSPIKQQLDTKGNPHKDQIGKDPTSVTEMDELQAHNSSTVNQDRTSTNKRLRQDNRDPVSVEGLQAQEALKNQYNQFRRPDSEGLLDNQNPINAIGQQSEESPEYLKLQLAEKQFETDRKVLSKGNEVVKTSARAVEDAADGIKKMREESMSKITEKYRNDTYKQEQMELANRRNPLGQPMT